MCPVQMNHLHKTTNIYLMVRTDCYSLFEIQRMALMVEIVEQSVQVHHLNHLAIRAPVD